MLNQQVYIHIDEINILLEKNREKLEKFLDMLNMMILNIMM